MAGSEPETTEKTYEGYLVINWRDDDLRFRKTEPESLNPTELAVPISTTVNVPEIEVPSVELEVDVPPASVEQAVTEAAERIAPDFEDDGR